MSNKIVYWLSKIKVSYPTRTNKRVLRYNLHCLIWCAFTDVYQDKQPFLFRITDEGDEDGFYVLVQSLIEPDWSSVSNPIFCPNNDIVLLDCIGVKNIDTNLFSDSIYAFRVTAAPIKNEFTPGASRGKKKYIVENDKIEEWFLNKAEKNGINVTQLEFTTERIRVRTRSDPKSSYFKISACQFDGLLQITQPNLFKRILLEGFGAKKTFGFGMVTIAIA
jgi:CRISPR system Cascade subunit CasE